MHNAVSVGLSSSIWRSWVALPYTEQDDENTSGGSPCASITRSSVAVPPTLMS